MKSDQNNNESRDNTIFSIIYDANNAIKGFYMELEKSEEYAVGSYKNSMDTMAVGIRAGLGSIA